MTIVGIERVTYGVDDMESAVRFYRSFGLPLSKSSPDGAEFLLAEGSRVVLRRADDASLPAPYQRGSCAREVVWGVDDVVALRALEAELGRDRQVRVDERGTLHCVDDAGLPIGFAVFERRPVTLAPSEVNAPGRPQRLNQHRKWFRRAEPKVIYHAVYRVPDHRRAAAFYTERLGFRISDVSRGLGIFMRAAGHTAHHNLFLMEGPEPAFDHVAYGVEDIDELMAGANHMQSCGYQSNTGLGRHRIGSALFYYVQSPCGGEAEYSADMDQLDDRWLAREWEPLFGLMSWAARRPDFMPHEASWDVRILPEDEPR